MRKCDVCGKAVTWRTHVKVYWAAALSSYTFCDDCGAAVVEVLKQNKLVDEAKKLIYF
jgi:hypothetical protein